MLAATKLDPEESSIIERWDVNRDASRTNFDRLRQQARTSHPHPPRIPPIPYNPWESPWVGRLLPDLEDEGPQPSEKHMERRP